MSVKFYPEKLKSIRKQLRMNISIFAKKIGVSPKTLWSWENGITEPSEHKIKDISRIIDVPINRFSSISDASGSENKNFTKDLKEAWFSLLGNNASSLSKKMEEAKNIISNTQKNLLYNSLIINAIMESSKLGIYIKNTENKYIIANKEFHKIFSLEKDVQCENQTDENILPTKFAHDNANEDEEILESGKEIVNEELGILIKRKLEFYLISKTPIIDSKNNIIGLLAIYKNITDSKTANFKNILLQNALDSTDTMVEILSYHDKHKNFQTYYSNKSLEDNLEITKEEIENLGITAWFNKFYDKNKVNVYNKYMAKGKLPLYDINKIKGTEDDIKIIETKRTIFNNDDKDYYIAVSKDITQKENNLKRITFLETSLDLIPLGLTLRKLESEDYIFVNKAFADIYDETKETFSIGGRKIWASHLHPENNSTTVDNNYRPYKVLTESYKIIKKDGSTRIIKVKGSIVEFNNERYIFCISEDITDNH